MMEYDLPGAGKVTSFRVTTASLIEKTGKTAPLVLGLDWIDLLMIGYIALCKLLQGD